MRDAIIHDLDQSLMMNMATGRCSRRTAWQVGAAIEFTMRARYSVTHNIHLTATVVWVGEGESSSVSS